MTPACAGRPGRAGTFVTSVVLALATVTPAAVRAEDQRGPALPSGDPPSDPRARSLTEEGLRQFAERHYDRAIEAFEASYSIAPLAGLLYDLAQAHRLRGDCAMARSFYTRFLASAPPEKIRKRAEARLAEMAACSEAARAPGSKEKPEPRDDTAPDGDDASKTDAVSAPPSTPQAALAKTDSPATQAGTQVGAPSLTSRAPAPTSPGHSSLRVVGWTAGAAGAVTATAGLVVALLGQSHMDAARDQASRANATADAALYADAATRFAAGTSERATGRLLLVVGGVVSVGGLAVILFAPKSGTGTVIGQLGPWIGGNDRHPRSNGLVFSARW